MTEGAEQMRSYSGYGSIADERGRFQQGGVAGSDYVTSSFVTPTPINQESGQTRIIGNVFHHFARKSRLPRY